MQDKPQNYGEFEELSDAELAYCSRALNSGSGNASSSRTPIESQNSAGTIESASREERNSSDNGGGAGTGKSVVEALENFLKSF